MDTDWSIISRSWLWEDDIDFKNECLDSHWTDEEDKPVESGNIPSPHHQSNDNIDHGKKKKTLRGVNRGIPWTEEEHRRFLVGLEKYGKGHWKSIAKFSVQTKSNSQVASHAQKYFKRLNSTSKAGRRHSINDVMIHDNPITMPAAGNNESALINAMSEIKHFIRTTPTPGSFGIPAIPEVQSLVQDNVVPNTSSFEFTIAPTVTTTTPGSFGIPDIPEIQSLVQDNVAPNLSSFGGFTIVPTATPVYFGIPAIPEAQSFVQDNIVPNLSSFEFVPRINDIQPEMQDIPSSSTSDIQQQEIGVPGSSSSGVSTVDPVFVLPHFFD